MHQRAQPTGTMKLRIVLSIGDGPSLRWGNADTYTHAAGAKGSVAN